MSKSENKSRRIKAEIRFYPWKVKDHSGYEGEQFQWSEMDGMQIEKEKVKEKFVNERTVYCE
jgi:hypothetical protein